jgi:UDP-glucose 4-epimerase
MVEELGCRIILVGGRIENVEHHRSNRNVEILGNGKQVRSFIYVDDTIESTIFAWSDSANSFEIYNIASEDWITVDDVANEIASIM